MDDDAFRDHVNRRLDELERQIAFLRREMRGWPGDLDLRDRVISFQTTRRITALAEEQMRDVAEAMTRIKRVGDRVTRLENPDG